MAASTVDQLMNQPDGEKAKFLNDIVRIMWPNICRYGSSMTKSIADPMFKSMLPAPMNTLHFTKVDFGPKPFDLDNVVVEELTSMKGENFVKLDVNMKWESDSDIQLDGDLVPEFGVRSVKMYGRMTVLLGPLIDVVPLIGAIQLSFINPPNIHLDFTGAANVADLGIIDKSVRQVILTMINSMVTLPNRYMLPMAGPQDYDFFSAYQHPLGLLRITVDKAYGFAEEEKKASGVKKLFKKITRSAPDCYAQVEVGGEEAWRTKTKDNKVEPAWGETHDFVLSDWSQVVKIDVEDQDVNQDDEVGVAAITARSLLAAEGKSRELDLVKDGQWTGGKVVIGAEFFEFAPEPSSFSASEHKGDGFACGVATILVGAAFDIPGERKQLKPGVKVKWGSDNKHHFQTAIKEDAPGMDINNPDFSQNFRVLLTPDLVSSGEPFKIELLNGEKVIGRAEVPFKDVQAAEKMTLRKLFDVGDGAKVKASICLQGVKPGGLPQQTLPTRGK